MDTIEIRNGKTYAVCSYPLQGRPILFRAGYYLPVDASIVDVASGADYYCGTYTVAIGPFRKLCTVPCDNKRPDWTEETEISAPKTRRPVRWIFGRWEILTRKGWSS